MCMFEGSCEEGVGEARRKFERSEEPCGGATSKNRDSKKMHVKKEIPTSKAKPETINTGLDCFFPFAPLQVFSCG